MPSTRDQRPYNVSYYARNREAEIARVTERQQATLAWLRELRKVPCVDCGGTFPPYVMDFDHRDPKAKSFSLTVGNAYLKNHSMLEAELAKCDVICGNCHRVRTAAQYASGVLEYGFKPNLSPDATPRQLGKRAEYLRRRREQMEVLHRIRELPCADCLKSFPTCAMEFDHREGTSKVGSLSRMAGHVKIATLLEEIAKCDIVCTNCHRVRTYMRREAAVNERGCGVVAARDPSKVDTRVRFPPPAPDRLRLIGESRVPYRSSA